MYRSVRVLSSLTLVSLMRVDGTACTKGVSRDTVILRLGPRASRGIRPPPIYIALRFRPATLTALWGRGSGTLHGSAKLFQVELGSRPAAPGPGVSGGARSDDPNRMSRPTPERALPSQVGGAADARPLARPPRLRGERHL
jgi:hypothetical protein